MSERRQDRAKNGQSRIEQIMLGFLAAVALSAASCVVLFLGWFGSKIAAGINYSDIWVFAWNLWSVFLGVTIFLTICFSLWILRKQN
ncbi:MAG: hypothetical protein HY054_00545 [Proteobacteria bacterium]|nr:hypothetical protein [Pseudomonadota bacterium]